MKKISVLLVFILLFTCGCYDYTELNEIALVSGISVDYVKDEFYVSFEILNTVNKTENPNQPKTYTTKGTGKSLSEAFSDCSLEVAKIPYLAHLKVVVLSEEVAREHVKEIIDFLIRDNHIRNIFFMAIAKDTSAEDIINNTDTNNPVASTAIANLIDTALFTNNVAASLNFEKFVSNIIDPKKDTYASSIKIENGVLKLGPLAIFKEYNMQTFLSEEESATFNLMNEDSKEMHFKINCPNDDSKFIIFTTFNNPKSSIEIDKNTATVKSETETRIVENHCKMNFKDVKTYETLQKALEEKIRKNMQKVVEQTIKYDSDILKIEQLYYQKYKKDVDFRTLEYKYDAKNIINRNGLIFEVEQ